MLIVSESLPTGESTSMAALDETAEDIQWQMAAARVELEQSVNQAFSSAKTLTDWRHHFREHPWLLCAASAAIGFLLVPGKRAGPRSNAQNESAASDSSTTTQAPTPRPVLAALLGVAANIVVKELTNAAMHSGREMLEQFLAAQANRRANGRSAQDAASDSQRQVYD